jgi:hypothetical protein
VEKEVQVTGETKGKGDVKFATVPFLVILARFGNLPSFIQEINNSGDAPSKPIIKILFCISIAIPSLIMQFIINTKTKIKRVFFILS